MHLFVIGDRHWLNRPFIEQVLTELHCNYTEAITRLTVPPAIEGNAEQIAARWARRAYVPVVEGWPVDGVVLSFHNNLANSDRTVMLLARRVGSLPWVNATSMGEWEELATGKGKL